MSKRLATIMCVVSASVFVWFRTKGKQKDSSTEARQIGQAQGNDYFEEDRLAEIIRRAQPALQEARSLY